MMNREEMKREMLSKVNVEAINAYISKTDSAATYDANVTKILEAWAENKVDIYVKFGRQLKIEKEVECNIPENQCRKLREDFIEEYKEPKYIILESNSAPSLGEIGIEKYKETLRNIVNEKEFHNA